MASTDTPPSISDVVQLPPTPHPTLDDVIPADDRSVSLSDAFATPAPSYSPTLAGATTSTPAALPAPPTPAPASAPGIVTPTAAAAVVLAAINSFDDEVTLLYDVFAIILAFFFPLATFCGVRFEALLACPGLNVWAVAFAFVVACEVGFEHDELAKLVFALIGMAAATTILYSMGLFSFTLMGLFSGVLLGSGVHDFAGQWVKEADDSDVAWSKVIYLGVCPLLFMCLVVFTEWRGTAIMWAFTGAYWGVVMIDWMGYRWGYNDEPRLWPTNLIRHKTHYDNAHDTWDLVMYSIWGSLTLLGVVVQFSWGPLPPIAEDGSDLREWEPLMWELEKKYKFRGEALEEMAKLQYQIEKKRIFREKLKYESKEARRVMKSVAKGTYKTSVQKQKESQDQLAEKRTAWYGSMAKAKGEGDVEGGADGPVMSAQ